MSYLQEGGCFCRNVRYKIKGEPVLQLFCFCSDCRMITGSDAWPGFMVRSSDFLCSLGIPKIYKKVSSEGRTVKQHFCKNCGSNLWGETEFGLISVGAGTLDNPDIFNPSNKVFTSGVPHWARVPENLESL
ncbi:hypothetical protein Misp06_03128 [Microbulbifer sp. NBRC 101763]|uniref:GFA family protein n=1 Tax=Microbulbifer TaxID=48073 RepID=UPI000A01CD1E|nr:MULTISPECIES: GFA family protein [Microbulbifer]WHI52469.1 GFA family protein [Microbulbifer sp. MLAF003]